MPKLPNIPGYVNNVLKEVRQVGNSWIKTIDAQDRARNYPYDSMTKDGKGREYWGKVASQRSKQTDAEAGQLAGAIFKGTRYNSQGKKSKSK